MDGVISDSEHLHKKIEVKLFKKYGISLNSEDLGHYTGRTYEVLFNDLIKKHNINTTAHDLYGEKEEMMVECFERELMPTVGVIDFISKLKSMRLKLGVASSSTNRIINLSLKKLKVLNHFEAIVSGEDVVNSKPHPDIFLKAAKDLSLKPVECIVIEDAKYGIDAAISAGMKCIGYKNPNSGNQDLSKADTVINNFKELDLEKIFS